MRRRWLSEGSSVSAVLKKNLAVCSDKSGLGSDLDLEALVIVQIPDSVTEIGSRAFLFCEQVAKVMIPVSVSQIGSVAFSCCSALAAVNIPDSVTRIPAPTTVAQQLRDAEQALQHQLHQQHLQDLATWRSRDDAMWQIRHQVARKPSTGHHPTA